MGRTDAPSCRLLFSRCANEGPGAAESRPNERSCSGLGLRVGLFNLRAGEQQSAPSVPDGYVVAAVMVMFPSFFLAPSILRAPDLKCRERGGAHDQRRIAAAAADAIKVAREFVIEHRHCAKRAKRHSGNS